MSIWHARGSPECRHAVVPRRLAVAFRVLILMAHSDRVFRMEEVFQRDGTVRLMLMGELDVAAVEHLASRLRELRKAGYAVRIDLSSLGFIDSSGIHEITGAVREARRDHWQLEVDGPMSDAVARAVDLVGVRDFLWPDER